MRTSAAQVGGSRTADTTGRSDFAADTTGRECSDTTDCTTLRHASAPARLVGEADGSMRTIAAQVGGSHSTAGATSASVSPMIPVLTYAIGIRPVLSAFTIAASRARLRACGCTLECVEHSYKAEPSYDQST